MVKILDTSVAIKWFVQEKGHERALVVLGEVLESPGDYAVPELFYFELCHVFNRLFPRPQPSQLKLLKQVMLLGLHRFSLVPDMTETLRNFQNLGLSGYDAAYVTLAKMLKGKWLSFDKKAHDKIAHLKLSELLLAE